MPPEVRITELNNAWEEVLTASQLRWDSSSKGRWTHKFLPDIRTRLATPLILDHHLTQFLTRHGDFYGMLTQLGLRLDPICACGEEESAEHVLFRSPRISSLKSYLELAV